MLKGPKDEGLALRKKCEEISRHLSCRGKERDEKKPSDSSEKSSGSSTYSSGSRVQLSLEQIDGLLGTDLVSYVAVSDRSASKSLAVTEKQSLSNCDKIEGNAPVPSCAMRFDDIALFIYKHGFNDLLYDDALRRQSGATSRIVARWRTCQEELRNSGILRTLARLLKQIHDSNFYRLPQEKIANAFTISIEKHRVEREGLSADWEFYAANHHPKIPLKDKVIYVQISRELSRGPSKRPTFLASNPKNPALSSVSGNKKQTCISDRRKSIPLSKSAAIDKPSKRSSAQCNVVIKGRARQRRVATKNRDLPINFLRFTAISTTGNEGRIKQKGSSSYTGLDNSSEVDGEVSDMGDRKEIVRERPSTTSQLQMTSFATGLGHDHGKAGSGHKASAEQRKSKFKLRNNASDLPSCVDLANFSLEYSHKNEPDGGLSTLARIEQLFPMPISNKEDFQRRAELEVEIDRLKILRW